MTEKFNQIIELIEFGEYFSINRPRQYGKTTVIKEVVDDLNKKTDFLAIYIDLKTIQPSAFLSSSDFATMIWARMTATFPISAKNVEYLSDLSHNIHRFIETKKKKVVLIVDHIETQTNLSPFFSFLGLLKKMFENRFYENCFHSVVFCSDRSVWQLSQKLSNYNHNLMPYNIETPISINMDFQISEIEAMLKEYCQAENVEMNVGTISERLFYYTSGQPFLISKLCDIITKTITADSSNQIIWTLEDIDYGVTALLNENNAHFEYILQEIELNFDLYNLAYQLLIDNQKILFSPILTTVKQGLIIGIFKESRNLQIHNRIYEQLIRNFIESKVVFT